MVEKAYKNRGRFDAAKTYVVHNPQENVEGTDLFCEDCDEEYLDERVDLQQGFQPRAPVFLAEYEGDDSGINDDWDALSEVSNTDLLWSEDEQSECCSEWSENAIEVTEVNNVEWIQQPDGSYSPWEWFPLKNGNYECFLVYFLNLMKQI